MTYVPDIPENAQRCSCPGCPSNPSQEVELYCGRTAHREHVEKSTCLCRVCPIFRVYQLAGEYYCEAPVH